MKITNLISKTESYLTISSLESLAYLSVIKKDLLWFVPNITMVGWFGRVYAYENPFLPQALVSRVCCHSFDYRIINIFLCLHVQIWPYLENGIR